jgi:hypothetical protein
MTTIDAAWSKYANRPERPARERQQTLFSEVAAEITSDASVSNASNSTPNGGTILLPIGGRLCPVPIAATK